MVIMDEERLSEEMKNAIIAYFEGHELVDFLGVPTEDLVDLLEEYIIDNISDVTDELGMSEEEQHGDGYD